MVKNRENTKGVQRCIEHPEEKVQNMAGSEDEKVRRLAEVWQRSTFQSTLLVMNCGVADSDVRFFAQVVLDEPVGCCDDEPCQGR